MLLSLCSYGNCNAVEAKQGPNKDEAARAKDSGHLHGIRRTNDALRDKLTTTRGSHVTFAHDLALNGNRTDDTSWPENVEIVQNTFTCMFHSVGSFRVCVCVCVCVCVYLQIQSQGHHTIDRLEQREAWKEEALDDLP